MFYITVLHLTWVYTTVQDYLLPFLICSQGTAGIESGSNQRSYLLAAVKGQTQDIHLAVWRPTKMSPLILTLLLTSVTSTERKKNAPSTLQKQRGLYIFDSTTYHSFSPLLCPPLPSPSLSFSFFSFPVTATPPPVSGPDSQCLSGKGEDYRGRIAITESGNACQHWNTQLPHKHGWIPDRYPCKYAEPHHPNKYQRTVIP